MEYILSILLLVIFLGVLAGLYPEGMWGNAITFVNVVTSGLLATNFFEPLSDWLDEMNDSMATFTYVWDFLMIWAVFAVSMIVLRLLTDSVSKIKVRFLKVADRAGSIFFACMVGAVMVCFTTFSMHAAPLGRNFMWGGFKPGEKTFLNVFDPDAAWLTFARYTSQNGYSTSDGPSFNPKTFVNDYADRRSEIEEHIKSKETIRTRG